LPVDQAIELSVWRGLLKISNLHGLLDNLPIRDEVGFRMYMRFSGLGSMAGISVSLLG